jgi:hypothetical protein
MPDRNVVLGKLDLVRSALLVSLQHTEILRHGVEQDDVDAITRGRWGLDNSIDFVHQLAEEIDREMPDWRPAHHPAPAAPGPDGWSGDSAARVRHAQPDAHLGAVE